MSAPVLVFTNPKRTRLQELRPRLAAAVERLIDDLLKKSERAARD
jgi:hypothetical protein